LSYNSFIQSFSSTSYTLAPATPTPLIAANPNRRLLLFGVNGVSPAVFKFGSAPTSATDGVTLGAASVSGGQGGSLLHPTDGEGIDTHVPVDSVWAFSALGTTVFVVEGVVANWL
jgi:hypothetical protein